MAAFQQRRHVSTAHAAGLSESSDASACEATTSDLAADDDAVLLFASQATAWSVVQHPRSQRTQSFTSHASARSLTTTTSGGGQSGAGEASCEDHASSLGSPASLRQAALLPAHSGDGVFFGAPGSVGPSDVDEEETTARQAARDGALFSSVYADLHDSSDDGIARSSAFSAYSHIEPPRQVAGASLPASTSDSSEWPLTEAALSTIPSRPPVLRAARQRHQLRDDDEESAELTSDSGGEEGAQAHSGARSQRQVIATDRSALEVSEATKRGAQDEQDEQDWAQSPHALSAGLFGPARRSRRPPPRSVAQELHPTTVLLPIGISPGNTPASSVRSRRSSSSAGGHSHGFKRRHRHSGTGRSASSQKRSAHAVLKADPALGASLSGQAQVLEEIAREEEERARRMTAILEERREQVRVRDAEAKILFGHAVRNYMSIDPATLALLSEPLPASLAVVEATPTPSRVQTPAPGRPGFHGAQAFAAHAAAEGQFDLRAWSSGGSGVWDEERADQSEEISDAETETDHEREPNPKSLRRAGGGAFGTATPVLRSRRRVSLSGPVPSRSLSERESEDVHPPGGHLRHSVSETLSHEERVLLGTAPAPGSANAGGAAQGDSRSLLATAWGGEVDSFELALSYWKRVWRRLRGGGGGGTYSAGPASPSSDGAGFASFTSAGTARGSSVPVAYGAGDASTTSPPTSPRRAVAQDLLVPEAKVGRAS